MFEVTEVRDCHVWPWPRHLPKPSLQTAAGFSHFPVFAEQYSEEPWHEGEDGTDPRINLSCLQQARALSTQGNLFDYHPSPCNTICEQQAK